MAGRRPPPGASQEPMTWQAFHLPKRGNTSEEYEDAYAANPEAGRVGIADGASESSFAGLWARLLVEGFSNGQAKPDGGRGWLNALQQRWSATVDGPSLPWYAEIKREEGAFATFLGLFTRQRGRERGTWHALAIGDSCLFQIRADRLIASFPVAHSEDFGSRPCLLGARPKSLQDWQQHRLRRRGRWLAGDRFLLMTDALAQWFLMQTERTEKPWQTMGLFFRPEPGAMLSPPNPSAIDRAGSWGGESMPPHYPENRNESRDAPAASSFADWVERLRDQGDLRNDDVTLLVIQM